MLLPFVDLKGAASVAPIFLYRFTHFSQKYGII